tara:strand:- start:822 stop:1235 length:414 start_codon:yes stop_codon:yes gene_type:complete
MLIKEFIAKTEKDYMVATLLKQYKVEKVKVKYKSMKDYAHYNVDTGTLELSSKYKEIKPGQIKEFLITILHEIYHAMDAKKYGWRKFKDMYEIEMNMISQGHYPGKTDPYKDNKYEINAEKFGVKNMPRWKSHFTKN